jgi:hypothetical protein
MFKIGRGHQDESSDSRGERENNKTAAANRASPDDEANDGERTKRPATTLGWTDG